VLSAARGLTARGHRVTIAAEGGTLAPDAAAVGAEHWPVPLRTKADISWRVLRAARALSRRLRVAPVDVLHAHTRTAQVAGQWLARRHRLPFVTTWHGFFRPNLGRRLWPCMGDRMIAVSEAVRRHLEEVFRVPAERIRLIHNGVDVARFAEAPDPAQVAALRARCGLPPGGAVIGAIGRLASGGVKGLDLVLAAAAQVRRQRPDLHVLLVGEGPRRAFLEAEAGRQGLREVVHMPGTVQDVRVPLALMDVFVFASRWNEGFGLSLLEAMAAGRPVIASRTGAIPEIVEDGREGLLVPVEDPAAIAAAITRLLGDAGAAAAMGARGRRRVAEAFDEARAAEALEAVYLEVISLHAVARGSGFVNRCSS
jgi:glycosyltransferase involved in cell wall biosynthesis